MVDNLKLIAAVVVIIAGIAVFYAFGDMSALLRALIVVVSVVVAAGGALTRRYCWLDEAGWVTGSGQEGVRVHIRQRSPHRHSSVLAL